MGSSFFLQNKNDRKLHEDTCIFICTNLNSIMGLFRANNTVANFWILSATLSAYAVVASEVVPETSLASRFFGNPPECCRTPFESNPDSPLFVCHIVVLDLSCFAECSAFY